MMTTDRFWELIEQTRQRFFASQSDSSPAIVEHEALAQTLSELEPEEIIQFDQRFGERIIAAYHWDLWAALFIFTEGCASDNTFEDFRAELLLCGRAAFESALRDADSLADLPMVPRGEEGLLSVPMNVYEEKTGQPFPQYDRVVPHPSQPVGEPWEEDDLPQRLPRFWKRFGEQVTDQKPTEPTPIRWCSPERPSTQEPIKGMKGKRPYRKTADQKKKAKPKE
ncbi:DUF4240 domain-containing protein [Anatilimnocola sp. NA78]|uniref:DUF4240 domain-containing protein n=1 Tax=Anatilimnocola sp. NA78 TaxID=3415683 RepID=UPI003CE45E3F